MCAFCRLVSLVQAAKWANHRCPLHLGRLLPFAFHPIAVARAANPSPRPRPTALDRCKRSWSSRSWNDASRLVPFVVQPRPCSTACRTCAARRVRQPSGPVRPRFAYSSKLKSRSRIRTRPLGTVKSGVSAANVGTVVNGRQDCPSGPVESSWLRFAALPVFRVKPHGRNASTGFLQSRCLVGKPSSKIGGKVGPKGQRRSFAVLFVGGFEHQGRHGRRQGPLAPR